LSEKVLLSVFQHQQQNEMIATWGVLLPEEKLFVELFSDGTFPSAQLG